MRKQKTVSFLSGTFLNNFDNGQERTESSFCSHHSAGFEVQHGFTWVKNINRSDRKQEQIF